jgi:hypothetical protein
MMGVVGEVRRTVENVWNRIVSDIIRQQKPDLDRKIDEMLKPPRINQIMQRSIEGSSIGRAFRRIGRGASVGRGLRAIRKLL